MIEAHNNICDDTQANTSSKQSTSPCTYCVFVFPFFLKTNKGQRNSRESEGDGGHGLTQWISWLRMTAFCQNSSVFQAKRHSRKHFMF